MSTIKVNSIQPAVSGSQDYAFLRCYVSYNNITPSINNSFNVSSVIDAATGVFTVNFDKAFNSAYYTSAGGQDAGGGNVVAAYAVNTSGGSPSTSSQCSCTFEDVDGGYIDSTASTALFVGELA